MIRAPSLASAAAALVLLACAAAHAEETPQPKTDAAAPPAAAEPRKPAPAADQAKPAAEPNQATPGDKPSDATDKGGDPGTRESICLMIESAAKAHDLPLEFFARVIWQESRFQPDAVGPVTRSGKRAQGIAQFMPGTASERRLLDPFDPVQALPKSAEFLKELRDQFGNLGLAAAAYNAGPRRVQEWLAGTGGMPLQTRDYVFAITGSSVDDWAKAGRAAKLPEAKGDTDCRTLMALLKRAPNPFVAELEQRVKLGADRPWGVQLAAGFNRNRALASYARAMSRLSTVIGERDPTLLSGVFRSRGTRPFYQVRIGAETRGEADDLCKQIRRAGQACLVLRNRG
ncbi:lytic transglycosylase domain-containing protein [Rhodopseudomonas palustris]|nr:lytic transglycosylase domain-containing protein [Rhodopseudomonas palustris]OPF93725.1 lytic transglycosylase [Rhodopseudomonas palustris]RJF66369.1 lytic transglycosylase [Rhodopseudomonas palustris]WAB80157.1 lytic transglycosylase domain-containing protein [Rhodopseudomonas palustris]WCL93310.1 lytic transglycosylase domain-containing protein [Rhodopseudomonas palustris CGA009]WND49963.1 lytic transglycosylase domain-containing protein [Rhodopseudomonas palustris]